MCDELPPVAPEPGVGRKRAPFAQENPDQRREIARQSGGQRPEEINRRLMVEAQEIAILERVQIDRRRQRGPARGENPPAVGRKGSWFVEELPPPLAQPEGELGVLAEGMVALVEDLTGNGDVVERRSPPQRRSSGRAEDALGVAVLAAVELAGAAVEVPPGPGEPHAAGVEAWRRLGRSRRPARFVTDEAPGHRCDARQARLFESRDERREETG